MVTDTTLLVRRGRKVICFGSFLVRKIQQIRPEFARSLEKTRCPPVGMRFASVKAWQRVVPWDLIPVGRSGRMLNVAYLELGMSMRK